MSTFVNKACRYQHRTGVPPIDLHSTRKRRPKPEACSGPVRAAIAAAGIARAATVSVDRGCENAMQFFFLDRQIEILHASGTKKIRTDPVEDVTYARHLWGAVVWLRPAAERSRSSPGAACRIAGLPRDACF